MADPTLSVISAAAPAPSSPTAPPKPGWKTSEFWLKIVAIFLTALYASGVIPTAGPVSQIAAIAATLLMALGYTVSRTLVKTAAIMLLLGGMAHATMACGPSAREKTIQTTLTATNAATAAFVKFDAQHQQDLVAQAKDKPSGEASLAAWRAQQLVVQKLLAGVYQAIAAAATVNDDPSMATMLSAAVQLAAELKTLGVSL